jgi:hypothetical protein
MEPARIRIKAAGVWQTMARLGCFGLNFMLENRHSADKEVGRPLPSAAISLRIIGGNEQGQSFQFMDNVHANREIAVKYRILLNTHRQIDLNSCFDAF